MPASLRPRAWLEIDLAAVRGNYRRIAAAVAPAGVMAVLKADAYGLGVAPIAAALSREGVSDFGVATVGEAAALAERGLTAQILGGLLPDEIPAAVSLGAVLPLTDLATARLISAEARRQRRTVRAHIKVDSGMGRLGLTLREAPAAIRAMRRLPALDCEGWYSHFPDAARSDSAVTVQQLKACKALLAALADEGISFRRRHIANSDAINLFPQAVRPPFNIVRAGIDLYGAFNDDGERRLGLRSVLTIKTRLIAVRRLPAGHTIGYTCSYRLPVDTLVGTIAAGYADGLPLALSNRGSVLVNGHACPVLGRVSMDYTTLSLAQAPEAAVGDEVICLGGTGAVAVTVADWARLMGTHPYEILCSFGGRLARHYLHDEAGAPSLARKAVGKGG